MSDKTIELQRVTHQFGALEVINDLSLDVVRGEFVAIVGPSGCGKTTLLNLISGYHSPTQGSVERRGRSRMVYQQDGLFPWLTARENIALGLRGPGGGAEPGGVGALETLVALIGLNG